MPAVPKSPRSKKVTSISKPKGAVRAKSGCYTCRIRRKKCDEKRINNNDDGPCETCFRLKLECLGFGAKRPDWLRETSRVAEIRDRIKAHLAAQGMIKGHAGSGSRTVVQEDILRLSDYREGDQIYPSGGSSSSASSPHRADSVESDRPVGLFTLDPARRSYDHHHPHSHSLPHHLQHRNYPTHYEHHHDQYPVHSDIPSRSDSPCDTAMNSSVYDHHDARDSMLYLPNRSYNALYETPARRSTFSRAGLYEFKFDGLYTLEDEPVDEDGPTKTAFTYTPHDHIPFELINESLRNYVNDVVKIQYLLGDKDLLPSMIWNAVETHPDSQEAVKLLSRTYYGRKRNPRLPVLADYEVKSTVDSLQVSLTRRQKQRFTADDAMAALHVISLFLFDGGGGEWHKFLDMAVLYVKIVLNNPAHYQNYSAALEAANQKDEFVIKTTIWFDVLASITTQEPPLLLEYIRELFKPNISWVGRPPAYSMMSPMGCQNTVVWALAETSYLSYWKRSHEDSGDLSYKALLQKVAQIDEYLEEGPLPERPQQSDDEWARYLASEIFRTATRLFLRTVESGAQPQVPEIKEAVNRTFRAICNFPNDVNIQQSAIVRSTVFGIFICGALTDHPDQRRVLTNHLEQNTGSDSGVGNCWMTAKLLRTLWENRSRSNQPVRWRDILKDSKVLLV